MRRLFILIFTVAAMLATLSGAAAAGGSQGAATQQAGPGYNAAEVTVGPGLPVWIDGKEAEFNPAASTVNGTLFVPAARLADMLGVKLETTGDGYMMTAFKATSGDTTISMRLGESYMVRNGMSVPLPAAPYPNDDWLYVPLRVFAEAFGYVVRWDELKHAVAVEKEWTALPTVGTEEKLKELLAEAQPYGNAGGVREDLKSKATETVPSASPSSNVAAATDSAAASGSDFSTTNVQVAGVDEGDLVKTDGTYLYQVSGRQLNIVSAVPAADLKVVATVKFDEDGFTPSELYVDGDKLVVIGRSRKLQPKAEGTQPNEALGAISPPPTSSPSSTTASASPASAPAMATASPDVKAITISPAAIGAKMIVPFGITVTKAIIMDIADRTHPKAMRTIELEGDAIATRKIGSIVYLAANSSAYSYLKGTASTPEAPSYRDSAANGADWKQLELPNVRYFPGHVRPSYLLVGGFDLNRPDQPLSLSSFLGAGQNVYVSQQALYVTQTQEYRLFQPAGTLDQPTIALHSTYDPKTTVYRFKLDNGYARYTAKGEVSGSPLNQFSMDEYDDVFRIATTLKEGNALYTLDQSMQTIGQLERLAPGERIYSARFLGGRAYLVTFKQVDPLFVIDVSNPRSPAVLGALKIPGYSDYLHPYDATHLIGFGKETALDSYGATITQGMKLSLFDVSDVSRPVEMFKTVIADRGTESSLLHDHKALLFDKDKGLLAFPITVREVKEKDGGGGKDIRQYGTVSFDGAFVYHIDLSSGFKWKGGITHLTDQDVLKGGYEMYEPNRSVRRALYIGDTLYTVSDSTVKANELNTLREISQLRYAGQ